MNLKTGSEPHNAHGENLSENWGIGTLLSHLGEDEKIKGAVTPPLFQNSLFVFDKMEDLMSAMVENPAGPPHHYSRCGNPTVEIAEKKIAALEGTEACKLVGCGMAAITTAIMGCVQSGAHAVVVDGCYGPVKHLFDHYLDRFGVTASYVDGRCIEQIAEAIRPETKLIYLESPTSLTFRFQDIRAITALAQERGITTIMDNTYNTPIHLQPAKLGVDLICHSATKYFGGHSDITAGAICGTKKRMDHLLRQEINNLGNILHPFSAWLLLRGLRTLKVRVIDMKRLQMSSQIGSNLVPRLIECTILGLRSHPQFELIHSLVGGTGGLFSFEPKNQDASAIRNFVNALKLFGRGISWGGFESLVVTMPVRPMDYEQPRHLVRLFCGLEEPEDLIQDLERALSHLGRG